MKTFKFFCALAPILVLVTFGVCLSTPGIVSADAKIFEQGGWVVSGAQDTAGNARKMRVRVKGIFVGKFSELKIARKTAAGNSPQVFSVKGSGALRAELPNGEFGGTFYGTGYWDCNAAIGFLQHLFLGTLDVQLGENQTLEFRGKASNNNSYRAPDFLLRLSPPKNNRLRARVSYTLIATRDLCVDSTRQQNHEGFRVARAASMFISSATHDSNQAQYVNAAQTPHCANLVNESNFIFNDPTALGQSRLRLVHTTNLPRNTPTLVIEFISPPFAEITPQGYVTQTDNPDDDNVDLWGNWDAAGANYAAGQVIGSFEFTLEARAPGLPCQI